MPQPPIGEHRPPQFTLLSLFVVTAVVALLLGLLVPGIQQSRESARRGRCSQNLMQIGVALHVYDQRWRTFPLAQVRDGRGRPMHSWRTQIQPYLPGYSGHFPRCQFAEPWDGPGNSALLRTDHPLYACPSDSSRSLAATSYLAVVGEETAWPRETSRRGTDVRVPWWNSLFVVEAADSGICWPEPRDLEFADFDYVINGRSGRGIRSRHVGGAHVMYGDNSVRFLLEVTSPDELRTLLTIPDADR